MESATQCHRLISSTELKVGLLCLPMGLHWTASSRSYALQLNHIGVNSSSLLLAVAGALGLSVQYPDHRCFEVLAAAMAARFVEIYGL